MMHSCKGPVLSEKKGDLTLQQWSCHDGLWDIQQKVVCSGYPQTGKFGREMKAVYTPKMFDLTREHDKKPLINGQKQRRMLVLGFLHLRETELHRLWCDDFCTLKLATLPSGSQIWLSNLLYVFFPFLWICFLN